VSTSRNRRVRNPMTASPRAVGKSRSDDVKERCQRGGGGSPPCRSLKNLTDWRREARGEVVSEWMCVARDSSSFRLRNDDERATAKCDDAVPHQNKKRPVSCANRKKKAAEKAASLRILNIHRAPPINKVSSYHALGLPWGFGFRLAFDIPLACVKYS